MERIKRWFQRTPKLSDRDRIRNILVKEVAYASALAGFLCNGINRGREARITIEIDGTSCEIGIQASAKEPLMEYIANWAVREKLAKHVRLEEFDQQGRGGGGEVMTVGPSVGVWFTEKQILHLPDDVYSRLYPPDEKTGHSDPEI
jgi:hypothetical protein